MVANRGFLRHKAMRLFLRVHSFAPSLSLHKEIRLMDNYLSRLV